MENEIEQKANEIFTKMEVYRWDEEFGYMTDDEQTFKKCNYMLDTIIDLYGDKKYGEVAFWIDVKKVLNNL